MTKDRNMNPVKDRILELCFNAFNQDGYRGVSMDLVARELRISKKTIYRHFSSKEDILDTAVKTHLGRLEQRVKESILPKPQIEGFIKLASIYREYLEIISPLLRNEIRTGFGLLQEWIELAEKQVFRKNFSRLAKALRAAGAVEYPGSTRDLAVGFFAILGGLQSLPPEDSDTMLKIFLAGIDKRRAKKVKKKKK